MGDGEVVSLGRRGWLAEVPYRINCNVTGLASGALVPPLSPLLLTITYITCTGYVLL